MWRVIRPAVETGRAGRTLPDATPDQPNRFLAGIGPRVAVEVRNLGKSQTNLAGFLALVPMGVS